MLVLQHTQPYWIATNLFGSNSFSEGNDIWCQTATDFFTHILFNGLECFLYLPGTSHTHTLFFDYVETIFWLISKVATCCYPTYTTRNSSFINQRHFRKKGSLTCICHGWHSIAIASDVVDIAAGLGSFAAAMIYAWFLYSFVVDAYFALEPIVFKWCW